MNKPVRRLYEQFQPSNYALELTPDKNSMSFKGRVTIKGKKTDRPSQRITFHQKDLTITAATIIKHDKGSSSDIAVERINTQATYDEVRLHTTETIYPGDYTVTLEFEGAITQPMHGIYPCYFDHEGKRKFLLATQFESHHAREVFPNIDEPEAKAAFDLTLVTPQGEQVLANTPVRSQENAGDQLRTTFETSPLMSSYLLTFVIGEMHCSEGSTKDGIAVRTWGTVAQPARAMEFANGEAITYLESFTEYFQTPYPLKKYDQVALPDFESGAMEGWGLATFREIALLTDPENRSISQEQYVAMVVAHEASHMWFGDLVTMKWWDDLWLNESFASIMEHVAPDKAHPDWHQWEQYTAADVLASSGRDIFKDVQSVHVDVNHPDEIGTLFDPAIVYAKGGRLLKMMREYIGDDAFRAGLKSYFAKYQYKNTVGDDLWREMSAASGKDIKAFMDPWLDQSGMPILSVEHTPETIDVSQKRFVLDTDNDTSIWPIPYLANQALDSDLLTDTTANLRRPSQDPVIFNQYGSGHMLVHYVDEATRTYIAEAFGEQKIAPESRINILNDLFLLARKGEAPLTDALDVVAASASEPRDAVWLMSSRTISTAIALTEGDESTERAVKAFRANLVREWYNKLGWNDSDPDTSNDKALRQTILSMMVASEDPEALAEAKKRFAEAKTAADLPAEQRAMIIAAVVKAGEDVVDQLIEEYKSTPNADLQLAISSGLTNTHDPKVGDYILEKALGANGFVRPQDIFRWYAYLMRNRYTRRSTWEWLKANWERLEKLFGDGKSFEYFVVYSAGPINTADWQKEFREYFEPKQDIIALRRNIKIAFSEIEARVAWRAREEQRISEYFKSQG